MKSRMAAMTLSGKISHPAPNAMKNTAATRPASRPGQRLRHLGLCTFPKAREPKKPSSIPAAG